MFLDSWHGPLRVLVVGICAYAALVLLLRVSGQRTLSKMNSFDFVVTIALGSTLATVLLSKDVALAEGATAFALLIFLQFAISWLSVRSSTVRRLVKDEPRLLFHQGEFLHGAMREVRVTPEEVRQAVRTSGIAELDDVGAVVLETDGTLSVMRRFERGRDSSLSNVQKTLPK